MEVKVLFKRCQTLYGIHLGEIILACVGNVKLGGFLRGGGILRVTGCGADVQAEGGVLEVKTGLELVVMRVDVGLCGREIDRIVSGCRYHGIVPAVLSRQEAGDKLIHRQVYGRLSVCGVEAAFIQFKPAGVLFRVEAVKSLFGKADLAGDEVVAGTAVQNGLSLLFCQQAADDTLVRNLVVAGVAVKVRDLGIHNDFLLTDGLYLPSQRKRPSSDAFSSCFCGWAVFSGAGPAWASRFFSAWAMMKSTLLVSSLMSSIS